MPMMPGSAPGSIPPPGYLDPRDPRRMGGQVPGTGPQFRPPAVPGGMGGMGGMGQGMQGPMPGSGMGIAGPPTVLLQGTPDPRLVLITEPDSARATSFRLLRDNLLAKRLPRVLAISSAAKNDGKTVCALNLALSLSEGAKVLLIEGNYLEPELGKIFCVPESTPPWPANSPWVSPWRIVEFSRTLHVGAMLPPPGQPNPRFEKTSFEQLIGNLRRFSYDFILIDAAALSASPTVSQLVATADATLLAVRSGITTARQLRRATEQIPEGRAIGIALIDALPTS